MSSDKDQEMMSLDGTDLEFVQEREIDGQDLQVDEEFLFCEDVNDLDGNNERNAPHVPVTSSNHIMVNPSQGSAAANSSSSGPTATAIGTTLSPSFGKTATSGVVRKPTIQYGGKYPQDTYSFIALNGPVNGSWSMMKILFFLFGMVPFVFQILFLVMLLWSETDELRGTIGENDNPDSIKDGLMGALASFIPANANQLIRWTQVTAILAYAAFPGSSLTDIVDAIQIFPRFSAANTKDSNGFLKLSCTLKFIQGVLATLMTFLLVVTSNQVIDIILNFTAVNLISNLDDHAFHFARSGDLGPALQKEAERIARTDLPISTKKPKPRHFYSLLSSGLVSLFLLGVIAFVIVAQKSDDVWVTKSLRVQFAEKSGLNKYSGCFEVNTTLSSVFFSRRSYDSYGGAETKTSFGYCREDRQWLLFEGNGIDPCEISMNDSELARSAKTDSFDISTSFDETWVSGSGTPLDLYFFDGGQNADNLYCDSFVGDGICDLPLNTLGYQYDGGDCCAATCTGSKCGRSLNTSLSGESNVAEVAFPHCNDPTMVPITIHFDDIKSSRDSLNTPIVELWSSMTDEEFDEWRRKETPNNPYFSVVCNEKPTLVLYVDEQMTNQSETIMVEDGAACSMVLRNSTTVANDILDDPIWHVDYTLSHGKNGVKILTGQSGESAEVEFKIIPECYFEKLGNFTDIASMYKGIGESNPAIDWLVEYDSENSFCENEDMFIERYVLTKMFFELNGTQQFISEANQCTWPNIRCRRGVVHAVDLQNTDNGGYLSSDIHNLSGLKELLLENTNMLLFPEELENFTDLTTLEIGNNHVKVLPTTIGQLVNLQELSFTSNNVTVVPTQIGDLVDLERLYFSSNNVTAVPNQIGNLVNLERLYFSTNSIQELPTEISQLSNLQELVFSNNRIDDLPIELGQLSNLQILDFSSNRVSNIPTEVGLVTDLRELFFSNNIIDDFPTELGQLSNLQELAFMNTNIGVLPTELGQLSKLQRLLLSSNRVRNIPSQIGLVRDLQMFRFTDNNVEYLPTEIGNLVDLQDLYFQKNRVKVLPTTIGQLVNLQELGFSNNNIGVLPTELGQLVNLQELYFSSNNVTVVPTQIGDLVDLERLYFSSNRIGALPTEIGDLVNLQKLYFQNNILKVLPTQIGHLSNLQELDFSSNQIEVVPTEIGLMKNLRKLYFASNRIGVLPAEIRLANLQRLYIQKNRIEVLSTEIGHLSNLQEFFLYNNRVKELPTEISQLSNLQALDFYDNRVEVLPTAIGQLSNLQTLDSSWNKIRFIPSEIGLLTNLDFLSFWNNTIDEIPTEIGHLTGLQFLYLDDNQITSIPSEIGLLTNLQEFYFVSGNNINITELPDEIWSLCNTIFCA